MTTPTADRSARLLAACALAAAGLFLVLLTLSLVTGVSQQWFEVVRPLDLYAERLRAADGALRALIAVDAVFIACYVATGVLFAQLLARGRYDALTLLLVIGPVAAGVLDVIENQHILAMLTAARDGLPPSAAALEQRMTYSATKWLIGHATFFLAGLVICGTAPLTRAFRLALLAVQLPVGAALWSLTDPGAVLAAHWLRALNLATGFLLIAWFARHPGALFDAPERGSGSGAPA